MSNAAFVDEAADKARILVSRETQCPGDTENAMRRIERKYGVPYAALWALRYRKPRDILISVYMRVCEAYEAQREEQMKRFEHERAIAQAKGRLAENFVRAADALAGSQDK